MSFFCSQCLESQITGSDSDDWFYDSIKRYKTLQMYDLQMLPMCMSFFNDNWLCLAGRHLDRTEILFTELPRKLFLSDEESGRCKSNDFEITAGDFFNGIVRHHVVASDGVIAVSGFKSESKLRQLRLETKNSGTSLVEENLLLQDVLLEPNFDVHPSSSEIIVTKTRVDSMIRYHLLSNDQYLVPLPRELSENEEELFPLYVDSNLVSILNSNTGTVAVVDLRSNNNAAIFQPKSRVKKYFSHGINDRHCVTLNSDGLLYVYDNRKLGSFLFEQTLTVFNEESGATKGEFLCRPKVRLTKLDRVSISGFDNFVYIYKLDTGVKHAFTHKGHSHVDGTCSCQSIITDHIWLPNVADDFLASCSSNGSLTCWRYKT